MIYLCETSSPLGTITLAGDGEALCGLWFEGQKYFQANLVERVLGSVPRSDASKEIVNLDDDTEVPGIADALCWLKRYFKGEDPGSLPPIRMHGTEFQELVWEELAHIAYGQTTTYGDIAKSLEEKCGRRMSARAVGSAVGRNPISVIVPCHRVIGASGALTGYAGGLDRKTYLLELEGIL